MWHHHISMNNKTYEPFGTNLRYLSFQDLERFFSVIDNPEDKLMMRLLYELGCRVGEFVRIAIKHLDIHANAVFIPAENTKTKQMRTSYISKNLMLELQAFLNQQGVLSGPEQFLFPSNSLKKLQHKARSENSVRRIFQKYIQKTGLQQVYGHDKLGRKLHLYTVHSLRHSHIMHAKHIYSIKDSVVAKQVGHTSLQAMSAYDKPSNEMVKEAYERARRG